MKEENYRFATTHLPVVKFIYLLLSERAMFIYFNEDANENDPAFIIQVFQFLHVMTAWT